MNSLIKNSSQELDTHNALIIAPETGQAYENCSEENEGTQAKGGIYKVEQKVVKKKKHNVRLEIPQNLPMRVIAIIATLGIAMLIPRLAGIMGIATEEVIEDTSSIVGMNQARTAIGSFYNTISTVVTIVSYVAAGFIFIALLRDMIKVEDAGEEEKIKEEVSEFKVPYPDEFYKSQITVEKTSTQTEKTKTKSSVLFVPFPSDSE